MAPHRVQDKELMLMPCPLHPDQLLDYRCFDCLDIVCSHCLLHGVHVGHRCLPLVMAYTEAKECLEGEVKDITEQIGVLEARCEDMAPLLPQLRQAQNELELRIDNQVEELMVVLAEREVALAQHIEETEAMRRGTLTTQQKEVEQDIAVITQAIDEVQNALVVADTDPNRFLQEFDLLRLQGLLDVLLKDELRLRPREMAEVDVLLDIAVYKSLLLSMKLEPEDLDQSQVDNDDPRITNFFKNVPGAMPVAGAVAGAVGFGADTVRAGAGRVVSGAGAVTGAVSGAVSKLHDRIQGAPSSPRSSKTQYASPRLSGEYSYTAAPPKTSTQSDERDLERDATNANAKPGGSSPAE